MTDFAGILKALDSTGVDFIVVGGLAGILHGSARTTYDVDVVYSRRRENLGRLVKALESRAPYLRGAPPGLPFRFDVETLQRGLNFTLTTSLGNLDLLGEIAGGGTYEDLLSRSTEVELEGIRCRVLALPALIQVKRAAGRTKDLEAIAELEALQEEIDRS